MLSRSITVAAIFSLSLMGANFTDYLREAHRVKTEREPKRDVTLRF
jgi:hypothetical protein